MLTGNFDVMLYVRNLGASVELYRDAFGFKVRGYWSEAQSRFVPKWEEEGDPQYVELSAGSAKLTLHASDGEVRGGGAIYHFETDDIDSLCAQIAEHGGEPSEPRDFPWGWRMSFVLDLDGHHFGFYRVLGGTA